MKNLSLKLFVLSLLLSSVYAQDVIEPIQKKGAFSGILGAIAKYWMWILVLFVAGVIIVFIIILIKKMKKRIDPFLVEYKKVKQMCKFQKDVNVKEIYLIYDKGLKYLGKYLGECITQDGYYNIMLWKFKKWYLFWVPTKMDILDLAKEEFVIRCNLNKEIKYKIKDADGNEEIKTVQLATDLAVKDSNKLLIKGISIERIRYFFYPVLKDKTGNITDGKIEIFDRERNSALIDTMYNQVEDFANVSRELININPSVRYFTKTGEPVGKKQE